MRPKHTFVHPLGASASEARWRRRPWLAAVLRLVAQALPIGLSVAAVYAAGNVVPRPVDSLALTVAWWITLSGVATLVVVVVGRLSRRLLPLAALLKVSLVFPDGAPSRFAVARRSGTVATLETRLAEAQRGAGGDPPAEAAERLLALVALLDAHDPLTRGHSDRVRAYAQAIGGELDLDRHELDRLNWAALLHDIGKLDVPRRILAKRGKPTDEELRVLHGHPAAGATLATPLREWLGEWAAAIEEHHERWDGAGYPRGLAGTEISLAGRIVAVADAYDVITSSRTYKTSSDPSSARDELTRCAGSQFDPAIVRALLAISIRRGRHSGVLAWAANAAVLARLHVTQAAGTVSAAALAVGTGAAVAPLLEARPQPAAPAAAGAPGAHSPRTAAGARSARPRSLRSGTLVAAPGTPAVTAAGGTARAFAPTVKDGPEESVPPPTRTDDGSDHEPAAASPTGSASSWQPADPGRPAPLPSLPRLPVDEPLPAPAPLPAPELPSAPPRPAAPALPSTPLPPLPAPAPPPAQVPPVAPPALPGD